MKKLVLFLTALLVLAGCSSAPAPEATATPTATPEVQPTATPEAVASDYEKGVWEGNTFVSKTLNMRFDLPEGWEIAEESFQEEAMKSGNELLDENAVEPADLILEFLINNPTNGMNIQATSSKVGPLLSAMSNDLIVESTIAQLDSMEELSYEVVDQGITTIAGDEYGYVYVTEVNYGLHQKMYFKKVGDYLFNLVVTVDEANIDILESFEGSISAY